MKYTSAIGKAAPGASYQALYLIGTVGVITCAPDTCGRAYVGTNERGVQYGDPS